MVHKVEIVGDIQLCAGRYIQTSNYIKRAAVRQHRNSDNNSMIV
nr:MAG TPA_asm: hypothetical protein [Caudoviricetes sp.]